MEQEVKQPQTLADILDERIVEHRKALGIARKSAASLREQAVAFDRTATQIEGAILELGTLRKRLGPPEPPKPAEPPAAE